MHTVPLNRSHIGACAWAAADAYRPDPFFAEYVRPHTTTFEHHVHKAFARRVRLFHCTSNYNVRVMVADDNDGDDAAASSHGEVMGWAAWYRNMGPKELPRPDSDSDTSSSSAAATSGRKAAMLRDHWSRRESAADRFERWALGWEDYYHKAFRTDPAYDLENRAAFIAHMRAIHGKLAEIVEAHSPTGGWIYLDDLVVDPSWQGRGVGKKLLKQGIEVAEREGVPVGLAASKAGNPLYKKMGFKVVGQDWSRDVPGNEVMVYWPQGMEPSGLKQFKVVKGAVEDVA